MSESDLSSSPRRTGGLFNLPGRDHSSSSMDLGRGDEKNNSLLRSRFNKPAKPSAPPPAPDKEKASKMIPAFKNLTRAPSRGNFNEDVDKDEEDDESGSDDDEEPAPGQLWSSRSATLEGSPTSALATQISVTVYNGRLQKLVRLSPYCVVESAIRIFMREFAMDEERFTPQDMRLYKLGRSVTPSTGATPNDNRQLLDHKSNLLTSNIRQGDELRLKNTKDKLLIQVTRPPNTTTHSFNYDFNTTVKQALVALLRDQNITEQVEQYGLYYAAKGIWLDDQRNLEFYDIDPQHTIDLRKLSQDLLLKISVPDRQNQMLFTLKVQRSQTVSEVVNMVTRKINFDTTNQYALFHPARNQWLDDTRTLQDYDIENNAKLEYKSKFRQFTIVVNGDWGDTATSPNGTSSTATTLLVDTRATVADMLNLLSLNDLSFEEENHSLYYQWSELIPSDTVVEKLPAKDVFEYRVAQQTLYITPAYDPQTKLAFDIDFSRPVSVILPAICRRFGVQKDDFAGLKTIDGRAVDVSKSLFQQNVLPSAVVVLNSLGPGWEKKSPGQTYVFTDDINIWDEPRDNEFNITFEDQPPGATGPPLIAGGSLNKLIEKLSDDKNHDLNYLKMFLLTYQSFTTPTKLITKIGERYYVPRPKGMAYEDFERNVRRPIQLRVFNFLKQWIEKYSKDFLDRPSELSEVGREVLKFSREVLAVDDFKLGKQLITLLQKLRDGTLTKQQDYQQDQNAPLPRIPFVNNPRLFQYHPEEIARQLTLIEFELFAAIKPSEFLNQGWNKKNAHINSAGILNISLRFNKTVLWVQKSILTKREVKKRAARMAKIIDIASYLQSLNNFSMLMAFVAGLNAAAITRLKFTRAELNSRSLKRLEALEQLMSADGSYKQYRAEIHRAEPPIIPYIGVYLADLTFIDDGNPDKINGLINFSKRRLDYSVIAEIQLYQNKPFNLRDYPELRDKLQDLSVPTENDDKMLYELSLQLEPRGADRSQIL